MEVEKLVEDAQKKHDEWALEPQAAADYVTLSCNLRLMKPTLPHVWAIARLANFLSKDNYRLTIITAWILCHEQSTVRSEIMPKLSPENVDELTVTAEAFLMDCGASPVEIMKVVAELTEEAFDTAKKKTVAS